MKKFTVRFKNGKNVLCLVKVDATDTDHAQEVVIAKQALFGNTVSKFITITLVL
jgi:hypothetical protein